MTDRMFSRRLPSNIELNPLARLLENLRRSGTAIADLTESNPTRAGFAYPSGLLDCLSSDAAYQYDPQPFGMRSARQAVADDYARRGINVDPDHLVLCASTSEAYSWLFKLLCNPGDGVLVPRPSYPLLEHLTTLEAVRLVPYELRYHGRWEIDCPTVAASIPETRALVLVSPNNPTGSIATRNEIAQLAALCGQNGIAIVADAVFADYPIECEAPLVPIPDNVLSFTLGGASKSLGLPQLKLAWIVVDGPADARDAALGQLELIADTFLSVGTPVQVAAPDLLLHAAAVRRAIHDRVRRNLSRARQIAGRYPSCDLLRVEGGWSAVVRVPATRREEAFVMELLERERILVHPGYFFDFAHEAFVVVSLLPADDLFADAFHRLLRFAN